MKKFKQLIAFVLCIALFSSMCANAAYVPVSQAQDDFKYNTLEYSEVIHYIDEAERVQILEINNKDVVYHYGKNYSYIVVQENDSTYYLLQFEKGTGGINVLVNGIVVPSFSLPNAGNLSNSVTPGVTRVGPWNTDVDELKSYDVGSLPTSVVGGIIGGAIGNMVTGPNAGLIVGAVAGVIIGGEFPIDYKLSVKAFRKSRFLNSGYPIEVEYYQEVGIYGGPSSDLFQDTFYENTDTYTELMYD